MKKIKRALLIVDLQSDYSEKGIIKLYDSKQIMPLINELIPKFELVLFTKDWYPEDHVNFKSQPRYCIKNTPGASLHPDIQLDKLKYTYIFKKNIFKDKYSLNAFFQDENEDITTELDKILQNYNVEELFIIGISKDNYIINTAFKASELGYKVHVLTDIYDFDKQTNNSNSICIIFNYLNYFLVFL
jgi:nicotinamidase/pyrazinamidase